MTIKNVENGIACHVLLSGVHNHATTSARALSQLRVSPEVQKIYDDIFNLGKYSGVPPSRCSKPRMGGMRQTFACLRKLGGTTNFNTVSNWSS